MRILSWVQTDVGQKRDHNEDSYLVAAKMGLYVVADGMGGHAGGDQASHVAVNVLREAVSEAALSDEGTQAVLGEEPPALAVLREAARVAGEIIFDLAQQNPHLAGMGTTLTALFFHSGRVHLAHVGDSRAYLFRDGRIEQLSEDHSWINEQVKAGLITDEEARNSKFKHIITRSVGFERDVAVDVMSLPVLMGDCFLICSDGLTNYLDNEELGRLLTASYYGQVPKLLVDLANERGGDDNITVMLIYVANDTGSPVVTEFSPRTEITQDIHLPETQPPAMPAARAPDGEADTPPTGVPTVTVSTSPADDKASASETLAATAESVPEDTPSSKARATEPNDDPSGADPPSDGESDSGPGSRDH